MLRKKILGEIRWIPPFDDAIDIENWSGADKYFVDGNYDLPPLKEGYEPAIFTLRQLTASEMDTAMQIQIQNDGKIFTSGWIEHIIRCGVVDWSGLYEGETALKCIKENNKLTKESYQNLIPFSFDFLVILSSIIFQFSRAS